MASKRESGLNKTLQNRQDFLPSKVWRRRRREKWQEVRQTLSLRPALEPPNLVLTTIVHPGGSHSGGGSSVAMDPKDTIFPSRSSQKASERAPQASWHFTRHTHVRAWGQKTKRPNFLRSSLDVWTVNMLVNKQEITPLSIYLHFES